MFNNESYLKSTCLYFLKIILVYFASAAWLIRSSKIVNSSINTASIFYFSKLFMSIIVSIFLPRESFVRIFSASFETFWYLMLYWVCNDLLIVDFKRFTKFWKLRNQYCSKVLKRKHRKHIFILIVFDKFVVSFIKSFLPIEIFLISFSSDFRLFVNLLQIVLELISVIHSLPEIVGYSGLHRISEK